jgi:hypothetical protein
MSAFLVFLVVFLLAQVYPLIIKVFRIESLLWLFTIIYSLVVIISASVIGFVNLHNYTRGEIILLSLTLVGFMVRVNVYYFKRERHLKLPRE